ncbi:hypothetical protein LINGRAHAP2_LOCUS7246 [Linum grandiflorum]
MFAFSFEELYLDSVLEDKASPSGLGSLAAPRVLRATNQVVLGSTFDDVAAAMWNPVAMWNVDLGSTV